ncbi:hypothetical protein [Paenibacillus sp. y28]|uniref:hypothetical protein n=1 Tax=Paenibacillus sp. y28 TaxID=3129110 RepID=UPI003019E438
MYLVLLGAGVLVVAWMLPKKKDASAQQDVIKEIEQTIEQFSSDLEEENKQLVELVTDMKKEQREQTQQLLHKIQMLEQSNQQFAQQLQQVEERSKQQLLTPLPSEPEAAASALEFDTRPEEQAELAMDNSAAGQEDQPALGNTMRDRYSELFQLHQEGKSIDLIAKTLNMNKGEVMLIMQLSKQEEEARDS